jgi:Domain of unknown function (DUF4136)
MTLCFALFAYLETKVIMASNTTNKRVELFIVGSLMLLLGGCASTLRSDVTSFQRWPANAASSTYSFKRTSAQVAAALEHATYEDLVRLEMNKLALKEAPASTKGRFEISLDYGVTVQSIRIQEPIFDYNATWHDPYFYSAWGWRPSYWEPYGFGYNYGPRIVGYQTINRDTSTHRLRVDISEGANKVFEATATNSGSTSKLSQTMPYLIRSVFDGFPGANGQTKRVEFDLDKNTVKNRQLVQPR